MTTIGRLRHRAVLKTRSDAAASGGGTTETYTTVATVWAAIEAAAPAEYLADRQTAEGATRAMTARWRSDADDITHVEHDGRRYRVLGIRDADDRKRFQLWDLEELRTDV